MADRKNKSIKSQPPFNDLASSIVSIDMSGDTPTINYGPDERNRERVDAIVEIAKHVIVTEGYSFSTDSKSEEADFRITSTYRPSGSDWHLNGAVDISAKNLKLSASEKHQVYNKVAALVSAQLGGDHVVINESLSMSTESGKQLNTSFRNGKRLPSSPYHTVGGASADHLHIQPDPGAQMPSLNVASIAENSAQASRPQSSDFNMSVTTPAAQNIPSQNTETSDLSDVDLPSDTVEPESFRPDSFENSGSDADTKPIEPTPTEEVKDTKDTEEEKPTTNEEDDGEKEPIIIHVIAKRLTEDDDKESSEEMPHQDAEVTEESPKTAASPNPVIDYGPDGKPKPDNAPIDKPDPVIDYGPDGKPKPDKMPSDRPDPVIDYGPDGKPEPTPAPSPGPDPVAAEGDADATSLNPSKPSGGVGGAGGGMINPHFGGKGGHGGGKRPSVDFAALNFKKPRPDEYK